MANPDEQATAPPVTAAKQRDVRLDFFRGLALVYIFLDHIPNNALSWATIRNFGFSDATEIFVFISGYSAALAYGGRLQSLGFLLTALRIWKRCWQLYLTQILVFITFSAQVAYTAAHFHSPMYSEEMSITQFFTEPHVTILEALLLRFRPANMDILPLYIALLVIFPAVLWSLVRRPRWVIAVSAALYLATLVTHWNLDTWPDGKWLFNPFAWQILFVIGARTAMTRGRNTWFFWRRPIVLGAASAYLAIALFLALSWHFSAIEALVPDIVQALLYPIDKTNLDILRLLHFGALAYVVSVALPSDAGFLRWRVARPLVCCGQHGLELFCLGIFLSFGAHSLLVEVNDSLAAQAAVSLIGTAILIVAAYYLQWYRRAERAGAGGKQ